MTKSFKVALGWAVLSALNASTASALEAAKSVMAEEITGVVVEADTGKPIPGAIAAIRFERNNTGHSGPHCFRSMAIEADAEGRFRFRPWTQENTGANVTYGVVTAYKTGYAGPLRPFYVKQSRRSIAGIPFSDTINIPKTDVRVELRPFAGSDEDRIWELQRLVANFTCRWRAEFDDMILLIHVREEINSSPIADKKLPPWGASPYHQDPTPSQWIDAVIKLKSQK